MAKRHRVTGRRGRSSGRTTMKPGETCYGRASTATAHAAALEQRMLTHQKRLSEESPSR